MATVVPSEQVQEPAAAPALVPQPEPRPLPKPIPLGDTTRLVSLDAYRGFIMLAMVSGGLGFPQVARKLAEEAAKAGTEPSGFWQFLGYQFDHVTWTGCSFWDLIQPSFMFMVGVAMPYSHASRVAKGASTLKIAAHTIYRSLLLIALGIFLSSNWGRQTEFTFVNVLTQIGLGYAFVYLLIGRGLLIQLAVTLALLVGYGYWFYSYPLPGADFNYLQAGVFGPQPWGTDDFFAHWNKNTNAAAGFDDWFLNLFPQPTRVSPQLSMDMMLLSPTPHVSLPALAYAANPPALGPHYFFNSGGYQTLNFVPSMITMILGLMAGEMLRRMDLLMREKFLRLAFAAIVCGLSGYILGEYVCPSVKRIWTPSWALYSAGWTFGMLAAFYVVIDWFEYRRWTYPLLVVGMNSIAMYCMANLLKPWVRDTVKRHFGQEVFDGTYFIQPPFMERSVFTVFAPLYAPIAESVIFLLILWLVTAWMYRHKIFIKI